MWKALLFYLLWIGVRDRCQSLPGRLVLGLTEARQKLIEGPREYCGWQSHLSLFQKGLVVIPGFLRVGFEVARSEGSPSSWVELCGPQGGFLGSNLELSPRFYQISLCLYQESASGGGACQGLGRWVIKS